MNKIRLRDSVLVLIYGIFYLIVYSLALNIFENKIVNLIILVGGLLFFPWSLAMIVSRIIRSSKRFRTIGGKDGKD